MLLGGGGSCFENRKAQIKIGMDVFRGRSNCCVNFQLKISTSPDVKNLKKMTHTRYLRSYLSIAYIWCLIMRRSSHCYAQFTVGA